MSDNDFSKMCEEIIEHAEGAALPAIIGELSRLTALAQSRLLTPVQSLPAQDSLLSNEQAAVVLGVTPDWLGRQTDLPFIVKVSEGQRRYSQMGIQKWIKRKTK